MRVAVARRRFLRVAAGSLLAAKAALATGCSWNPFAPEAEPSSGSTFYSEDFTAEGHGWSGEWLNVRYEGYWARREGVGIAEVDRALPFAVSTEPASPVTEYMAQPNVVLAGQASNVQVAAQVLLEGSLEAGVLARWSFDEAYALLVTARAALLCRYGAMDRQVLARTSLEGDPVWTHLTLTVTGEQLTGVVEGPARRREMHARDARPLVAGLVGVLANPVASEAGGRALFRSFRARSRQKIEPLEPRIAYRFAGAVVADGTGYKVKVTAPTNLPREISFELAREPSFASPQVIGPVPPRGRLGAVHAWLEGLEQATTYYWRPLVTYGDREIRGRPARFRTPPASGTGVRFVFASCTFGRLTTYPSFATARSYDPDFFLHAGDWGYADTTSVARRADHFQARWIRLLRAPEVARLIEQTPLLFWQDDHDYGADNGWAQTCPSYAVEAFDELHANPTNEFFDIRWGDVHVWCLDCRLFATDPSAPDNVEKSRLGAAQKAWLTKGMVESDAPVRIVASPMAFRNKTDDDPGWHNAYIYEREELLEFFSGLDATVVILSGDAHGQRLIHHHEFGKLYEITSSGTDFSSPSGFGQGNHDREHTVEDVEQIGFALVELQPTGPDRRLNVAVIASDDGATLFRKSFPVGP